MSATQHNPGLFTSFAERAMARVEDVIQDRECPWRITMPQYELLALLCGHQGIGRSVPLAAICERMQLRPREVKDLVQDLRLNFGVQIAASRDGETGGYFIAATQQEIEDSISAMWKQAITMLRVCRAMRGPQHTVHELLGQVRLELEQEASR
jgi:hypothetical protein